MSDNTNKRIGKYEIIRELGNGSIGLVYKARDPHLNRMVAIKILKTISLGDQESEDNMALKRFYHEAQLASKLKHPNIVTVFDAGVTDIGAPYIVMEYVEGKDLGDIIDEGGPVHPEKTLAYLAPIANAIDYAHTQGIIHRDIKPNNIMISSTNIPFLLDFSVAKLHDTSLTPAGTLLGTPEYMAPEQILGYKLDHRVDLFAFAVVIFETLTGKVPFISNDLMGTATMIVKNTPRRFIDLGCNLSESLEKVLNKALSKNPNERFQTAEELVENVAAALTRSSGAQNRYPRHKLGTNNSNIFSAKSSNIPEWSLNGNDWNVNNHDSFEAQPPPQFSNVSANDQYTTASKPIRNLSSKQYLVFFGGFVAIAGIVYYLLSSIFPNLPTDPLSASLISTSSIPDNSGNNNFAISTMENIDLKTLSIFELAKLLQSDTDVLLLRQSIPEASRRNIPDLLNLAIQHINHPDYQVKIEVLKLLVANPEYPAPDKKLEIIVSMLNDNDYLVRGFSIKALTTISSTESLNAIRQHLLRETNPIVISVIKEELKNI